MSLVINHNLMAMNAARNLGQIFGRLSTSTQRLSSGLRINSAADDAAGLAIRELMRSDIAVMQQGIRNANDGISMIQTAEGAMAVIDEKLTRMKELAEQAATGTYTTIQREIINSEYQAMAREIDRIANATEFNRTKLLDGSISTFHEGQGIKIHFGTGNSAAEDYYFVEIGDVRATEESGLQVGGDAKNDIWGTAGTGEGAGAGQCCGGGVTDLSAPAGFSDGEVFSYGYNWDLSQTDDALLNTGHYIAGMYQVTSASSLNDLITAVNRGTQSRVRIDFNNVVSSNMLTSAGGGGAIRVCLNDEVYYWGSATLATVAGKENYAITQDGTSAAASLTARVNSSSTGFWALREGSSVWVFAQEGGDNDDWLACDEQLGVEAGSATSDNRVAWYNPETNTTNSAGVTFGLGGENWGTLQAVLTAAGNYGVRISGRDVGDERDLRILDVGSGATFDINTGSGTGFASGVDTIDGLGSNAFTELQNAADGNWAGAEIRTQSSAQEALAALDDAILRKDIVRANLGAIQNRLENTITNLTIQSENLQASESRISDVDVATEMTEFTRNNILSQAATAMLSQANSLPQLALTLLG